MKFLRIKNQNPADWRKVSGLILLVLSAIFVVGLIYVPGLGGSFHFDDRPNLGGIQNIDSFTSMLLFITTNESGPLGRPIAMASFLVERASYPDSPEAFLLTNITIHLINGLLVFLLTRKLCDLTFRDPKKSLQIALVAALLWAILPIHAATVLLIVQRMTLLSTTFTLIGITGYLYIRDRMQSHPGIKLTLMTLWIGLAGILGVLSKESAVVLPLLILIIEATLLARPSDLSVRTWRFWLAGVLVLPSVFIFSYLAHILPYSDATIDFRGFSGAERLFTQVWILWDYIVQAFVPSALGIHPFHDSIRSSDSLLEARVVAGLGLWGLVITVAIRARKSMPFLLLGVLWYLGAHSVESTTVPLEMYFLHRSYLPLVGLTIFAGWAFYALYQRFSRIAVFGILGYLGLLGLVLLNTTSIWGNPRLAAELWYAHQPQSPRATGYLLEQYVAENDFSAALKLLDRKSKDRDIGHLYEIQRLAIYCKFGLVPTEEARLADLTARVRSGDFTHGYARSMGQLVDIHLSGDCHFLEIAELKQLIVAALDNPAYSASAASRHALNMLAARLDIAAGAEDSAVEHLRTAVNNRQDPVAVQTMFRIHSRNGDLQAIDRLIEIMRDNPPGNPITRKMWLDLSTTFSEQKKPLQEQGLDKIIE